MPVLCAIYAECACNECHNNEAHSEELSEIKTKLLEKNPTAFNRHLAGSGSNLSASDKEARVVANKFGCSCARSGCSKNYCECFKDGSGCHEW